MFSSWHRGYWLGGSALAILLIVAVGMNPWLSANKQIDRRSMGLDFVAFYTAGTFVREGRASELYNLPAVDRFQKDLAADNDLDLQSVAAWWNPPIFAALLAPLTVLSFKAAYFTWLSLNTICLIGAICLLVSWLPGDISSRYRGLVPLLICVSMPAIQTFGHAQNSAMSLLIVAGALTLARKNWPIVAGAMIAVLSYKPQIAGVIAIIFALSINWRVLIGFAAMGAALLAINVVMLPGTLGQYASHLGDNLHTVQFAQTYIWERHVTFGGFWRLLLQGRGPAEQSVVVVVLTLLSEAALATGLFYLWLRSSNAGDDQARESFMITALTGMPLLLPYFLDYDLLLLAVPAVLYARRYMNNPPRLGTALWTALYASLWINPGLGRMTHVNAAVVLLCATTAAMIAQCARRQDRLGAETDVMESLVRLAA